MKELGVIGSEEFVLGFRLAGIKKAFLAEGGTYEETLERALKDREVGILIVSSQDTNRLNAAKRRRIFSLIDPVIIQMGETGSDDLREKVKNAIGIDLYK